MKCPQCYTRMTEGYIPTGGGVFFFRKEERPGFFPFAEALPATSSWLRRAKLEAYRCAQCELVLFRYGQTVEEPREFKHR